MSSYAPSELSATSDGTNILLDWVNNAEYTDLDVYRKPSGGSYAKIYDCAVTDESYTDTSVTANTLYYYKIYSSPGGYSNEVSCGVWSDTETVNIAVNISQTCSTSFPDTPAHYEDTIIVNIGVGTSSTEGGDYSDTLTTEIFVTISETNSVVAPEASGQTLTSDYVYYLGTSAGDVHKYSDTYLSDGGESIDSYWKSKVVASFDIAPQLTSSFLSLYLVQITYVDLSANLPMIVSVSTDGGTTWEASSTHEVGNGDGTTKDEYFYFIKTGSNFDFKIEMPSGEKKFQIIRMLAFFSPGGETFKVN